VIERRQPDKWAEGAPGVGDNSLATSCLVRSLDEWRWRWHPAAATAGGSHQPAGSAAALARPHLCPFPRRCQRTPGGGGGRGPRSWCANGISRHALSNLDGPARWMPRE
jgi:hypothetical protein